MKKISWNHVSFSLPADWEVTSEGGSTLNGVIVSAPPEGAKLEIYWRKGGRKKPLKYFDKYIAKLEKRGLKKKSRIKLNVKGHEGYEVVLGDGSKVYVASWYCDETDRLFIVQMDGEKASQGLFADIINNINCHPFSAEKTDWRLMGIGLRLYKEYFVYERLFKIGFSMAYFLSRDKRVHVIQFSLPKYVAEDTERYKDTRNRLLKRLLPRMTKLVEMRRDDITINEIRHILIPRIIYGVLVERILECRKPDYVQTTLVKAPKKRLEEAIEIANNVYCSEW